MRGDTFYVSFVLETRMNNTLNLSFMNYTGFFFLFYLIVDTGRNKLEIKTKKKLLVILANNLKNK